jgi:CheY-like chemotaxis protein
MHGHINLSSKVGHGTRFSIYIPLAVHEAREKPEDQHIYRAEELTGFANMPCKPTVLLVEDYQPNILIASTILEDIGCNFEVAKNGHEALTKVMQRSFNLILMDIQMPVMDGYETVRRIRAYEKEKRLRRTHIIGVSAHAFHEDRAHSLSVGMDDYISKPFNLYDLRNRVIASLQYERAEAV